MLPGRVRVLVASEPVDFRRSYDGLCGIVRDCLCEDPLSPTLFVFRNRRGDQVKLLWWDRNGFAIWMKRLERSTFRFPERGGKSHVITQSELAMLLEGAMITRRAA